MRQSEIKLLLILLIVGLTSFSLLYWSFRNYQQISASLERFNAPDEKTALVNQLFQSIIQADNQLNNYILTGDRVNLDAFSRHFDMADSSATHLKRLVAADTFQRKRVDSLQGIMDKRFQYLGAMLQLKKEQNSVFFSNEALQRIKKQLQDTTFIEKAVTVNDHVIAEADSVEKVELIKRPDQYKGISGFFRKLFGRERMKVDTLKSLEAQLDYSLGVSLDTTIIRDYFIDTTLSAVKNILINVLNEEIQLQQKLATAELNLIRQDQVFIDNIKSILAAIIRTEQQKSSEQRAGILQGAQHATQQMLITGCVGILLSALFIYLIFNDLTNARHYRKKLEQEKSRAESLAVAKEDFLARMSHEIRTPLHSIIGFSGLLMEEQLGNKQQTYVKALNQSNHYLKELIDNILEQSKINAGAFKLKRDRVYMPAFCEDLQLLFRFRLLEKGLDFRLSIDPELQEVVLLTDAMKLKQVLINLLGNAIKFTTKGYVELIINLKQESSASALHITVSDTGPGIDRDDYPLIFKEFQQGKRGGTGSLNGTGLGLSISRHIIKSFGGDITLLVPKNEGTTLNLWFPVTLKPVHKEDLAPESSTSQKDIYYPIRVLAIEDDPWNALLLKEHLSTYVQDITVVDSAEEAIKLLHHADKHWSIIFTDINLPGMDGKSLLSQVRTNNPEVPVVALTANAGNADSLLKAGFSHVCHKPFARADLQHVLALFFKSEVIHRRVTTTGPDFSSIRQFAAGDTDRFQELCRQFTMAFEKKVTGFQQALADKDLKALEQWSHQLRSSCEQVNIFSHSEALQSIELYAQLQHFQRAMEEGKAMEEHLVSLSGELQATQLSIP